MTFLFYIPNYVKFVSFLSCQEHCIIKVVEKHVSVLARFKLSSHSLQIKLGRHNNTPINDRRHYVEDVITMPLMTNNIFLIHCSFFIEERDVLFH